MATTHLESYPIADFLQWDAQGQLDLNPYFQRGSVWTRTAQIYLIDTILRQLPIPKIYMRAKVDLVTKVATREIVDGQQRMRAIIDFARDEFALSSRAKEFRGLTYSLMDDEQKQAFLAYPISVDQLLNATDADVLEVFARLNSYTVSLNEPELRHARYQGPFKWTIHETAQSKGDLWDRLGTFTLRERVRMLDDSLMAEMFGVVMEGVTDGGQKKIDDLYKRQETDSGSEPTEELQQVARRVIDVLSVVESSMSDALAGTKLASPPHLLMVFAAVAHALHGIPQGQIEQMPDRSSEALSDLDTAQHNLGILADAMEDPDSAPSSLEGYARATSRTTQRIKSRAVRFPMVYRALLPKLIA